MLLQQLAAGEQQLLHGERRGARRREPAQRRGLFDNPAGKRQGG
jgi:hypothetical protein